MTCIFPQNISEAIIKASAMTIVEKEAEFDVIYKEQPNLLASVIVQQQMGSALEQLDVLFNILLVVHLSLRAAGVQIPTVTVEEQDRQLRLFAARVRFSEGLEGPLFNQVLQQTLNDCPEEYLYAYVLNDIKQTGLAAVKTESAKYLIMAGLNLVNCISQHTKSQYRQ